LAGIRRRIRMEKRKREEEESVWILL